MQPGKSSEEKPIGRAQEVVTVASSGSVKCVNAHLPFGLIDQGQLPLNSGIHTLMQEETAVERAPDLQSDPVAKDSNDDDMIRKTKTKTKHWLGIVSITSDM